MIKFNNFFNELLRINIGLLITVIILRIVEYFIFTATLIVPEEYLKYSAWGLFSDINLWAIYTCICFTLYPLYLKKKTLFSKCLTTANIVLATTAVALIIFFKERGAPLDRELLQHSIQDLTLVIKTSGTFNFLNISLYILCFGALYLSTRALSNAPSLVVKYGKIFTLFFFIYGAFIPQSVSQNIYSVNKTEHLISDCLDYLFFTPEQTVYKTLTPELEQTILSYQNRISGDYIDPQYPFYKRSSTDNPLGKFFDTSSVQPNLVFLIVESLSSDICGINNSLGHGFTPFLDSLAKESLFWDNCLSSSNASYQALPAILGSLPFGRQGFNMLPQYPRHNTIISTLKAQGYYTSFISGAPIYFDNQGTFIRNQGTDFITYTFPEKYNAGDERKDWNWGYHDGQVLNYGLELQDSIQKEPHLDVYVTISTHPPYTYPNKEQYEAQYLDKIKTWHLSNDEHSKLEKLSEAMGSFAYCDDQLRQFFEDYKKRDSYKNTIFVITGDHHGYYKTEHELGKFHVPLFIYSPLLKTPLHSNAMVSHLDITPSISNLLKYNFEVSLPEYDHWLGSVVDTSINFQSKLNLPFINWGKQIVHYIKDSILYAKGNLFAIKGESIELNKISDSANRSRIKTYISEFKLLNDYVCYSDAIIPDSVHLNAIAFTKRLYGNTLEDSITDNSMFPIGIKFETQPFKSDIKILAEFETQIPDTSTSKFPRFVISIINKKTNEKIYYDEKLVKYLNNSPLKKGKWLKFTVNDMINTISFQKYEEIMFKAYILNTNNTVLSLKNFKIDILESDSNN